MLASSALGRSEDSLDELIRETYFVITLLAQSAHRLRALLEAKRRALNESGGRQTQEEQERSAEHDEFRGDALE